MTNAIVESEVKQSDYLHCYSVPYCMRTEKNVGRIDSTSAGFQLVDKQQYYSPNQSIRGIITIKGVSPGECWSLNMSVVAQSITWIPSSLSGQRLVHTIFVNHVDSEEQVIQESDDGTKQFYVELIVPDNPTLNCQCNKNDHMLLPPSLGDGSIDLVDTTPDMANISYGIKWELCLSDGSKTLSGTKVIPFIPWLTHTYIDTPSNSFKGIIKHFTSIIRPYYLTIKQTSPISFIGTKQNITQHPDLEVSIDAENINLVKDINAVLVLNTEFNSHTLSGRPGVYKSSHKINVYWIRTSSNTISLWITLKNSRQYVPPSFEVCFVKRSYRLRGAIKLVKGKIRFDTSIQLGGLPAPEYS